MIRQLMKIPRKCLVACSGGPDSMAVLDFLRRSGKVAGVLHFNHKTRQSSIFAETVNKYCHFHNLDLMTKSLEGQYSKGSLEAFWSEERNNFYNDSELPVITGHTLDDAVEWWVFTALRGNPCLTPARNKNVLRPFLITRKSELEKWNSKHSVLSSYDISNDDKRFMRNFIRHEMIEKCLEVNPGLHKTIAKKIIKREHALKSR